MKTKEIRKNAEFTIIGNAFSKASQRLMQLMFVVIATITTSMCVIVNAQVMEIISTVPDKVFIGRQGTGTPYSFLGFGQGGTSTTSNYGMWHIGLNDNDNVFGIGSAPGSPISGTTLLLNDRQLSITPAGTVGIGFWSPSSSYKLHVNGVAYFNGNVYSWGTLLTSDRRHKRNIRPVSNLDNLFKINSVQYNASGEGLREQLAIFKRSKDKGSEGFDVTVSDYENKIAEREADTTVYFGFIAQELREIYPNLVSEDSDGFLSVNYVGLIPVLVDAIKELNTKIEKLEGKNRDVTSSLDASVLYQNNPNPFTEITEIKYYVPDNVMSAAIIIYDMVGSQIMKIDNLGRGYTSITVHGSQLKAGMYLYSLLVDGKEIDTKRMILTDK